MNEIQLLESLSRVGIRVKSIWDLVNTQQSYPNAIPVLRDALQILPTSGRTLEGVVRALATKDAKEQGVIEALIRKYHEVPSSEIGMRWAIGNTIEIIAEPVLLPEILAIVEDRSAGIARQMFVHALSRYHEQSIEDVLLRLLDDDDVALQALYTLGGGRKLKPETMARIRDFLDDKNRAKRRAAERALKKQEIA